MRGAAVGIALGAVHAASFAPLQYWWLQLLVLAAFFGWSQMRAGDPRPLRTAALDAFWFGFGGFALGLAWLFVSMHRYGGMPAPLAALAVLAFAAYLALYYAGSHALARRLARGRGAIASALLIAACWTLGEMLRGWVFTGFPWLAIGYGQVDGPLSHWAPIAGVYGVTALAVLTAALAARAFGPRPRAAFAALALLAASPALGWLEFSSPSGSPISVRLIQGNVPQHLKFDPERAVRAMNDYVERVERSVSKLTILPETAWVVPWSSTPPELARRLEDYVRRHDASIAIGMPLRTPRAGNGTIANSVMVLSAHAEGDPRDPKLRYDKQHLVPFGEFVPLGFAWFVDLMEIPLGEFARGDRVQPPIAIDGQRIAFNVCYEDLFGEEIAAAVRGEDGATLLANVSNLAWFGDSHALPQHLQIARMRSLETQRPMLRATNTGVTAAIDADGRVLARLPTMTAGVLEASVQGRTGLTPYVRWGNLPIALAAVLVLAAAVAVKPARIADSAFQR